MKTAIKRYIIKFYCEGKLSSKTVETLFKIYGLEKW